MSIDRVELFPIELPFRELYRTASGELTGRSMVVVLIHDSGGKIGSGEAVPLSLRGGPGIEQVTAELRDLGSKLEGVETETAASGEPDAIRQWVAACLQRARSDGAGPQVTCAIDVALLDLAGRLSGEPIWRLLGASEPRRVDCNASIDAASPRRAAETAERQAALGFNTFKVKVGTEGDHDRVAAVRSAVGGAARIRVDANGAWEVDEAVKRLDELGALEIELVEQPCRLVDELAALRARTSIPVVADESVATPEQAGDAIAAGACDAVTVKLAKVGGPLEAIRISAAAPSLLSSALDGPIGIATALHAAQILPQEGFAADFAHGLATLEMFSAAYASLDGLYGAELKASRRPGHGVDVEPERLREFALK